MIVVAAHGSESVMRELQDARLCLHSLLPILLVCLVVLTRRIYRLNTMKGVLLLGVGTLCGFGLARYVNAMVGSLADWLTDTGIWLRHRMDYTYSHEMLIQKISIPLIISRCPSTTSTTTRNMSPTPMTISI